MEAKPIQRKGAIVWLTGLCGSGKTTIAKGVEKALQERSCLVEVLDGDAIRNSLSRGLGYSREDRETNIRRLGFVANLLRRNDVIAIVAAVSPYQSARDEIRSMSDDFIEVYVNAPLDVCETRDPKGLYAMARAGEIIAFTGIDDPYEAPQEPDLICHTNQETPEQSIEKVLAELERRQFIPPKPHVEFFI